MYKRKKSSPLIHSDEEYAEQWLPADNDTESRHWE
jgi:hypothetical protein